MSIELCQSSEIRFEEVLCILSSWIHGELGLDVILLRVLGFSLLAVDLARELIKLLLLKPPTCVLEFFIKLRLDVLVLPDSFHEVDGDDI